MTEIFGRTTAGRVHVLRQAFRPSQPLKELIQEYAGPTIGPDFLLRSTKEVLVDSVEYSRGEYREQSEMISEALKGAGRAPIVIGSATMRITGIRIPTGEGRSISVPKKYRIDLFPPDDSKILNRIASLLDVYPSVGPIIRPPHHLYIDLPLSAIPRRDEIEEKQESFKREIDERVASRLYAASFFSIMASEQPRNLRLPTESEAAS